MSKKEREKRKKHKKSGAMAKWREEAEGDFASMFNLPDGTKKLSIKSAGTKFLDIIPYVSKKGNKFVEAGEYWWEKTFYMHRNIGVNDDWVVCPARTLKKPCPICEFRAKLADDPEADEKTIDALKPSRRIIVNVVDMKRDKETVLFFHTPHFYLAPEIKRALEAEFEDHEDNKEDFYLPEDHQYLKVLFEEPEGGFSGYKAVRVDFKAAKEDLSEDILEQAIDLDDILIVKDYDELKEMLYAGEPENEDEDDEPKKKSKKSKKEEPEDEDDDSELTDDDFDEEPEEKPKKRTKKSKKKRREEPEESDDDDDENDEDDDSNDEKSEDEDDDWDEEPKRKKRKKTSKKKRKAEDDDDWDDNNDDDSEEDGEDEDW